MLNAIDNLCAIGEHNQLLNNNPVNTWKVSLRSSLDLTAHKLARLLMRSHQSIVALHYDKTVKITSYCAGNSFTLALQCL